MDLEKIKLRLRSLGYETIGSDDFAIDFVMKKTEQHIKHYCNINSVPECLDYAFIDMVCGEFLSTKKSIGQLTTMQIEPIVKRIQDGDTTVEFNSTTDSEVLFNQLIDSLINGHISDLIAHRKLSW